MDEIESAKERQQKYQVLAYLYFGASSLVFFGGFIPSLFLVNLSGILLTGGLVIVGLAASAWAGSIGFQAYPREVRPQPPPAESEEPRPDRKPLQPQDTPFDDENWRQTHGGS